MLTLSDQWMFKTKLRQRLIEDVLFVGDCVSDFPCLRPIQKYRFDIAVEDAKFVVDR